MLREIIQNMSGIESTTNLTADQLEALAGGDTLRQEVSLLKLWEASYYLFLLDIFFFFVNILGRFVFANSS